MINLAFFDFLSPRITLYQNGKIRHSSKVSGAITLIALISCLLFVIYLSLELIQHKKPTANFYKTYHNETGIFLFDGKTIYHFFKFLGKNYQLLPFNSRYLRIIGSRTLSYDLKEDTLANEDHWIYDECETNYDLVDSDNNYFDVSNGACLKYYFNSVDKKYYDIKSDKFSYPYLIHGNSNPNNLVYTVFLQKCNNNSIENLIYGENSCASNEEIETFLYYFEALYLYFVDHNIDIHDYKKPIKNFLNSVSSGVKGSTFASHNLNFNPLIFKTKGSIIFDEDKEIISFIYDTNRKNTREKTEGYEFYGEISFWMQNVFHIYERSYKDIPDILAKVGGIMEIIMNIASFFNYFYQRYIIKYNTIILFRENDNKIFMNSGKSLIHTLKFNQSNAKKVSNKLSFSSNRLLNLNKSIFGDLSYNNLHLLNMKLQEINKKIEEGKIKKNDSLSKAKYNFNFKFTFLTYLLPCKSINIKNCLYKIEEFRKKLISEEHMYKSHLELCFLEHFFNSENSEKIGISDLYKKL